MHYYFEWSMCIVGKVNREHATDFTELIVSDSLRHWVGGVGLRMADVSWGELGWTKGQSCKLHIRV